MRLSYKKYPILQKLREGRLGALPVLEDDYFAQSQIRLPFKIHWESAVDSFRSQIIYPSKSFAEATNEARVKLGGLYKDISVEDRTDLSICGVIVLPGTVWMIENKMIAGDPRFMLKFFAFSKEGTPLLCAVDGCEGEQISNLYWISQVFAEKVEKTPEGIKKFIAQYIADAILIFLFKAFASVEITEVCAGKKARAGKEKLLNETGLDVLYLDSKWFTTLVRSEGFNVRGHFRLQPKKIGGEWTKEIIWIDEFQKHGYTSHARKLRPENTQQ